MKWPGILFVALFASLPSVSKAQNPHSFTGPAPASEDSASRVVNLLQESHDLDPLFNLGTRIYLLERQADAMSRVDAALGEAWTQELLALAPKTKGDLRSRAENSAMSILVRLNPDRALTLLHSMSKDEPQADRTPSLPNMKLVQRVFEVLVERDGVSALPLLEQEAARMSADGPYPYSALGYAVMQSVSKEWSTNRPHAIEVVQQVFEQAFDRYRSGPRMYLDDYEFGRMLQVVAGGIQEAVRPALGLLVNNLLTTDTSKYRFEAGVYTNDGKAAKVDNAIDAAILDLGGLINRLDPELAQQLESTRPELQMALQYAKDGRQTTRFFGGARPQTANRRPPDSNAENATDAMRLANINPEAAIAKAKQLPEGDTRADTMLQMARDLAGKQPERAQELIAEVEGSNKSDIPELQLDLISAKASLSGAQDKKNETGELLQQGFELATPIIAELQKSGNAFFIPGLPQLVQLGMRNNPDSTITFVQSVPASWLKADLLLGAASALTMGTRLPIGSKNLQKPENSN